MCPLVLSDVSDTEGWSWVSGNRNNYHPSSKRSLLLGIGNPDLSWILGAFHTILGQQIAGILNGTVW